MPKHCVRHLRMPELQIHACPETNASLLWHGR